MTAKQSYIELKGVRVGYKTGPTDFSVAQDVSIGFEQGSMYALVGINGSGKSTLLKSMAGLLPLLGGETLLMNKSITRLSVHEISQMVSVVLTGKIGGFNLRAYDVVAGGQMPYTNAFHKLEEHNLQVIEEALNTCGLSGHSTKLLHELSDGLFQKTMIARALAQQTPVMLLDEPTAYLDYASRHELMKLLKELAEKKGKCIVVSTHDLDLVLKYCDSVVALSNGKAEEMKVKNALQNQTFREICGGYLS